MNSLPLAFFRASLYAALAVIHFKHEGAPVAYLLLAALAVYEVSRTSPPAVGVLQS
jgi:hypothetical protein